MVEWGALTVGFKGPDNSMVISGGGEVRSGAGTDRRPSDPGWNTAWVGFRSANNRVTLTDPGSVWSNRFTCIGEWGAGNLLTISNGAAVFNDDAWIGRDPGANDNAALVTGAGSLWRNEGTLTLGNYGLHCSLGILAGGGVEARNLTVGAEYTEARAEVPPGYNTLHVEGGLLAVSDGAGGGELRLGMSPARFVMDGGTATVDRLVVADAGTLSVYPQYGPNRVLLNAGTLTSGGTTISNGCRFVAGDGNGVAILALNGGVHAFADGLCIRSNSVLRGHGTVRGEVTVEGDVLVEDGTLVFSDNVRNHGRIQTSGNGAAVFHGRVLNLGRIVVKEGSATFAAGVDGAGTLEGDIRRR